MSPDGTYSTSTQCVGKIYAASYAAPTPAMLSTAVADMQTAALDAAGRTGPNFLNLGSGASIFFKFNSKIQRSLGRY